MLWEITKQTNVNNAMNEIGTTWNFLYINDTLLIKVNLVSYLFHSKLTNCYCGKFILM